MKKLLTTTALLAGLFVGAASEPVQAQVSVGGAFQVGRSNIYLEYRSGNNYPLYVAPVAPSYSSVYVVPGQAYVIEQPPVYVAPAPFVYNTYNVSRQRVLPYYYQPNPFYHHHRHRDYHYRNNY